MLETVLLAFARTADGIPKFTEGVPSTEILMSSNGKNVLVVDNPDMGLMLAMVSDGTGDAAKDHGDVIKPSKIEKATHTLHEKHDSRHDDTHKGGT